MFLSMGVLKNFTLFTGKDLCRSLLFLQRALLKTDSNTGVFLWIFRNFLEQLFWIKHLWWLLLTALSLLKPRKNSRIGRWLVLQGITLSRLRFTKRMVPENPALRSWTLLWDGLLVHCVFCVLIYTIFAVEQKRTYYSNEQSLKAVYMRNSVFKSIWILFLFKCFRLYL